MMIATVKNYDVICFQLRNNLYTQLDRSLQEDIDLLSEEIKRILITSDQISSLCIEILSQVFNLRVKAINRLASVADFDYFEVYQSAFLQVEKLKSNKKLEVLSENILFALRCNQRIIESLFAATGISSNSINSNAFPLAEIDYRQFLASLTFANLDNEFTQKIIDWTNASLHIEFVLLAADIISENILDVSETTINELAFLVADSAQEYSALAVELGILKQKSKRSAFTNLTFDEDFIVEQKQLADLGMDYFASNLREE